MVITEVATNGYVVRGRSREGHDLIAVARHYEEVSHYVMHFLYAETTEGHSIPQFFEGPHCGEQIKGATQNLGSSGETIGSRGAVILESQGA